MNLYARILKLFGWKVNITAPRRDKCVICVAPHTSNWDFILGILAYKSLGRRANFLMKESWFFWPLGGWLRHLGGIPVSRKVKGDLTASLIHRCRQADYVNLAITPEGTRSGVTKWHTGFLRIAFGANLPVQLGIIDFRHKEIIIQKEFTPTADFEADLKKVQAFYAPYKDCARYPDKFKI